MKKNNMKPFNIEQVKAGKRVVTTEGHPARFLAEIDNDTFPLVFVIKTKFDSEFVIEFSRDGSHGLASRLGLRMAPEKKEYWMNVYRSKATGTIIQSPTYFTRHEAVLAARDTVVCANSIDCVNTVKLYEEEA